MPPFGRHMGILAIQIGIYCFVDHSSDGVWHFHLLPDAHLLSDVLPGQFHLSLGVHPLLFLLLHIQGRVLVHLQVSQLHLGLQGSATSKGEGREAREGSISTWLRGGCCYDVTVRPGTRLPRHYNSVELLSTVSLQRESPTK